MLWCFRISETPAAPGPTEGPEDTVSFAQQQAATHADERTTEPPSTPRTMPAAAPGIEFTWQPGVCVLFLESMYDGRIRLGLTPLRLSRPSLPLSLPPSPLPSSPPFAVAAGFR